MSLGAPLVLCGPAHSCCRRVAFPTLEVESTFKVSEAALHYVQFVKYDVTVSFMAQVLDTVTYLVPQVLDTAS